MLLETSAYPKPGNVHRTGDFSETRFEHFLASAASLGSAYRWAAHRGVLISKGILDLDDARLGKAIRLGVENMIRWQRGGNTSLGTILLLVPIAASAALTLTNGKLEIKTLRANSIKLLRSTTHIDSLDVYRAISRVSPGGIGSSDQLDVMSPQSLGYIERNRVGLMRALKISARRDSIASELVSGYRITCDIGYPYFASSIDSGLDLNAATVNTFLKILSMVPDTLIARKVGTKKACYVSERARECLEAGGLGAAKGLRLIRRLDNDLRVANHELNPGTTADLVSAVLALALLRGLRP